MNSENNDFKKNELCWVKVKGYPWWPAIICDINTDNKNILFHINYLCDRKKITVNKDNIRKWKEKYDMFKHYQDYKMLSQLKIAFKCALKVGEWLSEELIDLNDHEKFLEYFKITKEWHKLCNVNDFFYKKIKKSKKSDKSILKSNKKIPNNIKDDYKLDNNNIQNISLNGIIKNNVILKNDIKNYSPKSKNFIGKKKRRLIFSPTKETQLEIMPIKHRRGKYINKKNMSKIKVLVNNITTNLDDAINKIDKYQKYFEHEVTTKKINLDIDDKDVDVKIELTKYIKSISELFGAPINISKTIQSLNIKKSENYLNK